jgi:hypothetical protein
MAIDVMTWVWNHSRSRHSARLVLLAIADSMNTAHSWAWPSTKEIARKANLTDRAVQLAVADLAKLGELEVGYNEGPKGCNRFRVVMTTPEKFSPPKSFHPEDSSPPKDFRESEFAQASGQTPEDFSPPENSSPPKSSTLTPEEFSPVTVKNRKRTSSKKSAGDEPPREDVDRICVRLADRIEANGSKRPNVTETWRREARLLLDADKRTEEQVRAAIDWCQGNAFWCSKVMSMPALRDKYDRLRLEAKRERDELNGNGRQPRRGGASDPLTDQRYGEGSTVI